MAKKTARPAPRPATRNPRRTRVGSTGKMVVSAVKKLMKHTGWTARTIVKFIRIEFGVNTRNLGRQVSRALKTCVRQGLLKSDNGRYRLKDMEAVCRPSGATIEPHDGRNHSGGGRGRGGRGGGRGRPRQPQRNIKNNKLYIQRPLRIYSPSRHSRYLRQR